MEKTDWRTHTLTTQERRLSTEEAFCCLEEGVREIAERLLVKSENEWNFIRRGAAGVRVRNR